MSKQSGGCLNKMAAVYNHMYRCVKYPSLPSLAAGRALDGLERVLSALQEGLPAAGRRLLARVDGTGQDMQLSVTTPSHIFRRSQRAPSVDAVSTACRRSALLCAPQQYPQHKRPLRPSGWREQTVVARIRAMAHAAMIPVGIHARSRVPPPPPAQHVREFDLEEHRAGGGGLTGSRSARA
jgi:hypothetical protein